jgi:hypothetical protein
MINDHLAFSSAGNAAIEKAISIDLNKATNKDCLTTDDLLDIIKAFYKRVADTNCDAILALPFYFLIAGKGRDGNASLISGGNIKGRLDAKDVPLKDLEHNLSWENPRTLLIKFPSVGLKKAKISSFTLIQEGFTNQANSCWMAEDYTVKYKVKY